MGARKAGDGLKVKAEPVSIPLAWGSLAGLRWARPGQPRILCLHGWLDNAASFVPLASHMQSFDLLAIDLAGHGFSCHRPETSRYYYTDYIFDLDAALQVLGWDRCHLVGHSMGGALASCIAAADPDRVDRLVMLDAVGNMSAPAERTARQLALSLQSMRKPRGTLRPYESVEQAMLARQQHSRLSDDAARLLCERSLEHTGDFYQWRTDPRLNWRSPHLMTDAQVIDLLSAIVAPTLVISSDMARRYLGAGELDKRLQALADCTHLKQKGGHHFHMEYPAQTAAAITRFLAGNHRRVSPKPRGES